MKQKRVAEAINTLAQVRATLRGLRATSDRCVAVIKRNGGGKSEKWIATLREVDGYVAKVSKSERVVLTRR